MLRTVNKARLDARSVLLFLAPSRHEIISSLTSSTSNSPLLQCMFSTSTSRKFNGIGFSSLVLADEMKQFMKVNGLILTESHSYFKVSLPACLFGDNESNNVPVFLNKITGDFVCPSLAVTGPWRLFNKLINIWVLNTSKTHGKSSREYPKSNTDVELKLSSMVQNLWDNATPIEQLSSQQFKNIIKTFKQKQRNFSLEDFVRFGTRVNEDSLNTLFFPVRYLTGEIIGVRVVKIVGYQLEEEDLHAGGVTGILPFIHNLEAAVNSKHSSCVVVGSVLDTVVLSARTSLHVIALPDLTNLHPNLLPFLDNFTSITLWLGSDVQSIDVANLFARKIGERRCQIVSSKHQCAITSLRNGENLQGILDSARSCHQHLNVVTTFDEIKDDVYLELINARKIDGVKWTRFEGFNSLLLGFRRGEMTVVTGMSRGGKTTFMSEYSLDLCKQGVNTLWISFDGNIERLIMMMMKQFSLVNLDEVKHEDKNVVADTFSNLPMYFSNFHKSQDVDMVMEAMNRAVYVHDLAHIIIDNIKFMGDEKQDLYVEKFRHFATEHNCHVTLVIPSVNNKIIEYSMFRGSQEADNVLLLREKKRKGLAGNEKYIEVIKNRYAGDLGVVPLVFSKPCLTMSKKAADYLKKHSKKKSVPTKKTKNYMLRESNEMLLKPKNILKILR